MEMHRLRTVVLVSPDASDIYFANQMKKNLNVVGVVIEKQYAPVPSSNRLKNRLALLRSPGKLLSRLADDQTMRAYMRRTSRTDQQFFGQEAFRLDETVDCKVIRTEGARAINEPRWVMEIENLQPDVITVCGSSILKEPVLSIPPKGVLNLHGGLSQFYRGVWTTLWAVHNGEPEKIGCTVHYVSKGIDDGDIIYQGRPEIEAGDDEEILYTKVVRLGCTLMIKAVNDIENDAVESYPLVSKGKLCLNKSVTPEIIRAVQKRVASGVIPEYLREKDERDRQVIEVLDAFAGWKDA
jgi:folate-dependent phosphoribosylglycinamide formyltransferase PurN